MKIPVACFLLAAAHVSAQIPSFPGAEGFGGNAMGGRGGDVYIVTNLNSTGAGSFYNGLTTIPSAGRTIIFAVSGQIRLASGIGTRITGSKLTIAGQTAPGDGILLKDGTLRISGDDIVIRHLRFRHGKNGSGGDCIDLDSGCQNAILDHISMSFSTDENISSYNSPPENITMQWALNAWGLEPHSCGGLWDQSHATCHHTLWAHNHTRNPKARPSGLLEWTNNVTFDWDIGFIMGDSETPASWKSNVRGNYFICPPGNIRNTPLEKARLDRNGRPNFSVYLDNNLHDRDGNGTLNGTDRGYSIVAGSAYDAATNPTGNYIKLASPVTGSSRLTIDSPLLAYKKIVSNGGALRPDAGYAGSLRDEVDTRLIQNLTSQTRNHITRESELAGVSNGGFGTFAPSASPIDSDKDGMPDAYESALGWNPAVQDHNTVLASSGGLVSGTTFMPAGTVSGYTRLEEFLHFKSVPHAMLLKGTASNSIDLSRYASGFSNNPVFTLSNVSGGSVAQSGAGGRNVVFTANASGGRGGFLFTVTDADGISWTQQFAICISNSGAPVDLHWRGSGSEWDTSSLNWLKGSSPSVFSGGVRVTFNSTGAASPNVYVSGSVLASTIDVDGSSHYTFSGPGSINSTNSLTKKGSGTLTLSNTSTNSLGDVQLEDGLLRVTAAGGMGSAKINATGGALSLGPSSGVIGASLNLLAPTTITPTTQHELSGNWTGTNQTVTLSGSSVLWTISGTWTGFSGRIQMGNGSTRVRLNGNVNNNFGSSAVAIDLGSNNAQIMNRNGGTIQFGSLESTGASTSLGGTQTVGAATTYSIGALNTHTTFAGEITDGGNTVTNAATSITKVGSGSWNLTGIGKHSGTTAVSSGSLFVNGSFVVSPIRAAASPVTVSNGATLGGSGSIAGLITTASGANLAPGPSLGVPGTLSVAGGLTLAGTNQLFFDLSDSPSSGNDKVSLNGGILTVSSATLNFNINPLNGVLASGTYNLIDGTAGMTANPAPAMNLIGLPVGARQSFALQRQSNGASPAFINLVVSGTAPASLVWSGTNSGGLWNLSNTGNFTGGPTSTFFNWDAVTFNDTSNVGNVVLEGILQPRSIHVTNQNRAYQWSGPGMIDGKTSLVKSGTGTLTISPNMVTVSSSTVAGSNQVTVSDASGLAVGMAVNGGGFPYGSTITAISGTTLTLSASTSTTGTPSIAYHSRNSFSGGTSIGAGGTIQLGNEAANRWGLGTGAVTFNGGTLRLYDFGANLPGAGDFPNAMIVPAGQSGTLHTPQRGSLSGGLTGSGDLNLVVKFVRGDFFGDWSAFTGRIFVTAATGSEFRMAKNYSPEGFPRAAISLSSGITMKHVGILSQGAGTTIEIGELSGTNGILQGGVTAGRALTYLIGGKGTDALFSGSITEQVPGSTLTNIVKTGAGRWTLAGTGSWAGGTLVNGGTLEIKGSVTSAGAVSVSSGSVLKLDNGTLATESVKIENGGTILGKGVVTADLDCRGWMELPGYSGGLPGALNVTGSVFLEDAILNMRVGSSSDLLNIAGDVSISGILRVAIPPGTSFGRYKLVACDGGITLGEVAIEGLLPGGVSHLSTTAAGSIDLVIDDSDEDGLPDSWEMLYFGNLLQTGLADPDADGQSNFMELLTGTSPADATSTFKATLSFATNQLTLSWPSVPGKTYAVETHSTLNGAWNHWLNLPAAAAPAKVTSHTFTPVENRKFYRIRLDP